MISHQYPTLLIGSHSSCPLRETNHTLEHSGSHTFNPDVVSSNVRIRCQLVDPLKSFTAVVVDGGEAKAELISWAPEIRRGETKHANLFQKCSRKARAVGDVAGLGCLLGQGELWKDVESSLWVCELDAAGVEPSTCEPAHNGQHTVRAPEEVLNLRAALVGYDGSVLDGCRHSAEGFRGSRAHCVGQPQQLRRENKGTKPPASRSKPFADS
mmetsp:Transcript_37606/g.81528  ORF Transcript_37606/g.81528 Transcript_37606/m.81528 type:complete len:212 (+) Transcript_37606:399-1034(+)